MLELRNVLNIKEYSEKLRSKKLGKHIFNTQIMPKKVWEIFLGRFIFARKRRPRLPLFPSTPRPQHFPENIFEEGVQSASPDGNGPHPPTRYPSVRP